MKALVTGATGFIGRHLVERLIQAGYEVTAFLRDTSDPRPLESMDVEIVRGDVRNPCDVERAVDGCGLVFHLAVNRQSHGVIVDGTANVAHAAARAKVGRMVFTSSTRVYGLTRGAAINEDTPIKPEPGYGEYKAEVESLLLRRQASAGPPVVIARLPLVLGPGSGWRAVFDAIAAGRFRMIGSGKNRYQPVDVSDVTEGLLLCGTVPGIEGRTYILAGEEPRPLREIIHCIARELGVRTSRSAIPASALRAYAALNWMVLAWGGRSLPRYDRVSLFLKDHAFNLSRARHELGYSPKVPLEETIRRTAAWYRDRQLRSIRDSGPAATYSEG